MRTRLLDVISVLVIRRPALTVLVSILLAAMAGWLAAARLGLNADTNNLIAADRPDMQRFNAFVDEFGDLDVAYVVIDSNGDVATAQQCVDEIVERLSVAESIDHVYGSIKPEDQLALSTRSMGLEQLTGLAAARDAFPIVSDPSTTATDILAAVEHLFRKATQPRDHAEQDAKDEQGQVLASAMFALSSLFSVDSTDAPGQRSAIHLPPRRYLTSDGGDLFLVEFLPRKNYDSLTVIDESLRLVREILEDMRGKYPQLAFGMTGMPVLQAEEMHASTRDMTRAAITALVLCTILFIAFFRGIRKPLLTVFAFACATGWTYGLATLLIGEINLLSSVFILVMVGVGLDYGIHVITRFREPHTSESIDHMLREVMHSAVRGNVTGAITSSIVFLMAVFTTFQGLRELGVIAGSGLLLCLLAMSVTLPALLVLFRGSRASPEQAGDSPVDDSARMVSNVGRVKSRQRAATVVIATLAVSAILVFLPGSNRFDDNLLNLHAEDAEAARWEQRISEDASASAWFGAIIVEGLDAVPAVLEQAAQHETIAFTHSILDLVQPPGEVREVLRKQLHGATSNHGRLDSEVIADSPREREYQQLRTLLHEIETQLEHVIEFTAQSGQDTAVLSGLRAQVEAALVKAPPIAREHMNESLSMTRRILTSILEGDQLPLYEALPAPLRRRTMSPDGRFLIRLYPSENIWERDAMERFVTGLRAIDAQATGAPFIHLDSLLEMRRSFIRMSTLAVVAIMIIVLIDFRRPTDVLLAMVPLAFGILWMLRIMALCDIPFNLANFFALPILIGLSVDGGVHILHTFRDRGVHHPSMRATKRAVLLTGLTTIIGFGSLTFAHHRGLQTLGWVMAIGAAACLVAALVVLPAILEVVGRPVNSVDRDPSAP